MAKVAIGARTLLYPLSTVLVGANVGGKPTFPHMPGARS